jgi:hypothetical protein
VFDNVWALRSETLAFKISQLESATAYFLGFGAWLSACLVFLPPYLGPSLAYALLPAFILAAAYRDAPRTHAHADVAIWTLPVLRFPIRGATIVLRATVALYVRVGTLLRRT